MQIIKFFKKIINNHNKKKKIVQRKINKKTIEDLKKLELKKIKAREAIKRWKLQNPEKVKANAKKWATKNREKIRAYRKTEAYKIKQREYTKRSKLKNKLLLDELLKTFLKVRPLEDLSKYKSLIKNQKQLREEKKRLDKICEETNNKLNLK